LKYFLTTKIATPAMPTTAAALKPKIFFSRRV